MADMGIIPAGAYTNKSYVGTKVATTSSHKDEILLYDAQTSGRIITLCLPKRCTKTLKSSAK